MSRNVAQVEFSLSSGSTSL